MKILIKNISLFFSLALVTYLLLIFVVEAKFPQVFSPNVNYMVGYSQGHLFTRINEAKNLRKNIDVLFLGSSHAYRGFDPRNFKNKSVFNLGSSIQSPIQTQVLLNRYLEKINPKTIIYEVYPAALTVDGVEASLDLISNDRNDFNSLKMALELNNIKTYNTLIYGYFADFLNLNENFVEPIKKGDDIYISGGYVEKEVKYYKHQITKEKNEWKFNPKQIKKFEENISLIKRKNINLILVYAPFTKSLYNSYTNNNYVDSLMESYGLPYYNFNELMLLDDSIDFYDPSHLNQIGVNKFNKKLIEIEPQYFNLQYHEN
jgi:hypothetical protein